MVDIDSKSSATAAQIHKYLAVIELTSREPSETVDRIAMLAALIDRLKGISQALSSFTGFERSHGQAPTLPVIELYVW